MLHYNEENQEYDEFLKLPVNDIHDATTHLYV